MLAGIQDCAMYMLEHTILATLNLTKLRNNL